MFAIYDPEQELWLLPSPAGDETLIWSGCSCARLLWNTKEDAVAYCTEKGINPEWVVAI